MINKREIGAILITVLIIAFSISILDLQKTFLPVLVSVFSVIAINTVAKKAAGYYFESEIEIKPWEVLHFGAKPTQHFKKPIPFGFILPLISKILFFPFRNLVWMASLVFDVKPKVYKSAKRHGLYSFSETTEFHLGMIAAIGIGANIVFAILGYLLNFPTFAMIGIYYAFFNMIPISNLDGNKIFFGNIVMWSFLASIVLLGLFFVIFII